MWRGAVSGHDGVEHVVDDDVDGVAAVLLEAEAALAIPREFRAEELVLAADDGRAVYPPDEGVLEGGNKKCVRWNC